MSLLYVILAFLGLNTSALGDPRFDVREAATAKLAAWWPLTGPALDTATRGNNPEIARRAAAATNTGATRVFGHSAGVFFEIMARPQPERLVWLLAAEPAAIDWKMVDTPIPTVSAEAKTTALKLLFLPYAETGGLPWLPEDVDKKFGRNKDIARALCRLAYITNPGVFLACDPDYGRGDCTQLLGVNDVRFWSRGLGSPLNYGQQRDELRDKWRGTRRTPFLPWQIFSP